MKTPEIWNLTKTIIFVVFLRGWDIKIQYIFQSKLIKNHTCNPNMFLDASNDIKNGKVSRMVSKWGTQNPSRIVESTPWDLPGSLCVHLWVPLDCKLVPKWCPRTYKWSQNYQLGTLKADKIKQNPTIQNITNNLIFLIFIDWFQSWKPVFLLLLILSVCKSPVNWLPEGPAAGAKP